MILRIRAHHLLCMMGFRGLGYSPEFVENMQLVVASFFSAPGMDTELAAGADDICSACPNLHDGACHADEDSERNVAARDEAVLRRLGLSAGGRMDSPALTRLVVERIDDSALAEICAGCQWLPLGHCEAGLRSFREALGRA